MYSSHFFVIYIYIFFPLIGNVFYTLMALPSQIDFFLIVPFEACLFTVDLVCAS